MLTRLAVRALDTPAPGLAMAGLGDGPIAVTQDGSGIAEMVGDYYWTCIARLLGLLDRLSRQTVSC